MWRVPRQTRRGGRFDNWGATGDREDSARNFLLLRGVGGRADGICDDGKMGLLFTRLWLSCRASWVDREGADGFSGTMAFRAR